MRFPALVLALATLSSGVAAQYSEWKFTLIWDQSAEFISRGSNGGQANSFVSQAFQYGYVANLRTIRQVQYQMNDQNLATRESWHDSAPDRSSITVS